MRVTSGSQREPTITRREPGSGGRFHRSPAGHPPGEAGSLFRPGVTRSAAPRTMTGAVIGLDHVQVAAPPGLRGGRTAVLRRAPRARGAREAAGACRSRRGLVSRRRAPAAHRGRRPLHARHEGASCAARGIPCRAGTARRPARRARSPRPLGRPGRDPGRVEALPRRPVGEPGRAPRLTAPLRASSSPPHSRRGESPGRQRPRRQRDVQLSCREAHLDAACGGRRPRRRRGGTRRAGAGRLGPPAGRPREHRPPTVTGIPSLGQTLTVTPGTWNGGPRADVRVPVGPLPALGRGAGRIRLLCYRRRHDDRVRRDLGRRRLAHAGARHGAKQRGSQRRSPRTRPRSSAARQARRTPRRRRSSARRSSARRSPRAPGPGPGRESRSHTRGRGATRPGVRAPRSPAPPRARIGSSRPTPAGRSA